MPKIKKASKKEVRALEMSTAAALRGTSPSSSVERPLADSYDGADGEEPVSIIGATLHALKLTPRGYGYEVSFLIPMEEEEKLGALRRLSFQQLVDIMVTAATAESWDG